MGTFSGEATAGSIGLHLQGLNNVTLVMWSPAHNLQGICDLGAAFSARCRYFKRSEMIAEHLQNPKIHSWSCKIVSGLLIGFEIFVLGVEFPCLVGQSSKSEGRVLDFLYRFDG